MKASRTRFASSLATLALAGAAMTGCAMEPQSTRAPRIKSTPADVTADESRLVTSAKNGFLRGAVGPLRVDTDTRTSTYDDGWYLSVESTVELEDRAAMALFSLSNGSDILVPGFQDTFLLSEYDSSRPFVTMLGCVGQEAGIYDEYDMPADRVDVEVVEGQEPGASDVLAVARFYDRAADGTHLDTYREVVSSFTLVR